MTNIISAYHSQHEDGYLVIAIARNRWFIYNGRFRKPNVAKNLAKAVSAKGVINEENWIERSV